MVEWLAVMVIGWHPFKQHNHVQCINGSSRQLKKQKQNKTSITQWHANSFRGSNLPINQCFKKQICFVIELYEKLRHNDAFEKTLYWLFYSF